MLDREGIADCPMKITAAIITLNEEDHIRAACFKPGLGLSEAWEALAEWDDELASKIPFSYSQEFGYITACPTNLGTGMREIHTVMEWLDVKDMIRSAQIVLEIVRVNAGESKRTTTGTVLVR